MNRERCHKLWLKRWNKAWKRASAKAGRIYKENIAYCNPWYYFWDELDELKKKK